MRLHSFQLQKCLLKRTLQRRVLFWCFESCSCTPYFPANRSTFMTCPTQLWCCLNIRNTSKPKSLRFPSQGFFVLLPKTRAFTLTAFVFPTTVLTVDVGSPSFFCDSSSLPFQISLHSCEISSFSFTDNAFCCLSAMVPSDTKWQDHQSTQNERHCASGTVTKGGT